jgi:hypothetical protein
MISRYFTKTWWQYYFAKPFNLRALICRIRNHPYGVVWYTLSDIEPDMHCVNCGDNLG